MTTSTDGWIRGYGKPFRYNDRSKADSLEADVKDLRDRLRYETGRERQHTIDDIDRIEAVLCQMHC